MTNAAAYFGRTGVTEEKNIYKFESKKQEAKLKQGPVL
jgi:hypothetical protein